MLLLAADSPVIGGESSGVDPAQAMACTESGRQHGALPPEDARCIKFKREFEKTLTCMQADFDMIRTNARNHGLRFVPSDVADVLVVRCAAELKKAVIGLGKPQDEADKIADGMAASVVWSGSR